MPNIQTSGHFQRGITKRLPEKKGASSVAKPIPNETSSAVQQDSLAIAIPSSQSNPHSEAKVQATKLSTSPEATQTKAGTEWNQTLNSNAQPGFVGFGSSADELSMGPNGTISQTRSQASTVPRDEILETMQRNRDESLKKDLLDSISRNGPQFPV